MRSPRRRPLAGPGAIALNALVTTALVLGACNSQTTDDGAGDPLPSAVDAPLSMPAPTSTAATPSDSTAPRTTTPTTSRSPASTVPVASSTSTTAAPPTAPIPTITTGSTPYAVPSPEPGSGWGDTHAGYSATDIFVPSGCGGPVISPVNGEMLEVRRVDGWSQQEDNPATRGGKSVSILGDDGVRYYLAHFAEILPALEPGSRVGSGEELGAVGSTGRSSACHIHFGISPPCQDREWSVRRGAVWPYPYLNAWRAGEQRSPVDEIRAWVAANPNACADAALDVHANDG